MDDRQPLPPGFSLDDGVEIVELRTADSLCLVYDAVGKGGRPLKVKEYFPDGIARREASHVVAPIIATDRDIYAAGLQSFIAFCERLAAIEHKAVEPLLGLIEGYGTAYLVLEQPRGVRLTQWIEDLGRPVGAAELEGIANGICEGLAVAHAADLLHLDLGPDAVLVQAGAEPMLIDFAATAIGLAASAVRPAPPPKLGYAPPEREAGDLVHMGVRSDIYAAAAILYRVATGETPPGAGLRRAGDTVAGKLAGVGKAVPRHVLKGIAQGLALDPLERPASAATFHALLRAPTAVVRTEPAEVERPAAAPITTEPVVRKPRQIKAPPWMSRPLVMAVAAGAFAFLGAIAYTVLPTRDKEEPAEPAVTRNDASVPSGAASTGRTADNVAAANAPLDRASESKLKAGERIRECPGCPEMVLVPPGSFMMGSAATERGHEKDEEPQHKVEIKAAFAMSRGAVTRAEFELFVASSGYRAANSCRVYEGGKWVDRSDLSFRNPGFAQDGDHPVVCVSWADARAYADWLSQRTGKRYRLPTEAEWEYAARAGTSSAFWWGNEISTDQANYDGTLVYGAGKTGVDRQATVRALNFEPNAFGLYQMHGNVSQWVEDCWNPHYRGAPADSSAWIAGDCTRRVLRGGSWGYAPKDLRAAYREGATASYRNFTFGFRVVRAVEAER